MYQFVALGLPFFGCEQDPRANTGSIRPLTTQVLSPDPLGQLSQSNPWYHTHPASPTLSFSPKNRSKQKLCVFSGANIERKRLKIIEGIQGGVWELRKWSKMVRKGMRRRE
jgi:hypothetical protein